MQEAIGELLYHPDPAVRLQGAELAIAAGDPVVTVDEAGVALAPRGVHGPLLRALLEAPSGLRTQIRTLYLALDDESRALLPRLVELPGLSALHLLGEGPLDLAPLADLPLKTLVVGGSWESKRVDGLERLAGLETLVLRADRLKFPPDLRPLRALRSLRLNSLPPGFDLDDLPAGLTSLRVAEPRWDFRPEGFRPAQLYRLPLEDLALPSLPEALDPAQLPALRALRTAATSGDARSLLGWPLERLDLRSPTDDALLVLAEHPTLRALELTLPARNGAPYGGDLQFTPALAAELERLEVFAPYAFPEAALAELPWPPGSRCPLRFLQERPRQGQDFLPPDVRERSLARWQAGGHRWKIRAPQRRALTKVPRIKAILVRWPGFTRTATALYEAAIGEGLPLLTPHTARSMQALLLAFEVPTVLEPAADGQPRGRG